MYIKSRRFTLPTPALKNIYVLTSDLKLISSAIGYLAVNEHSEMGHSHVQETVFSHT
jgi:hypothetical protein